MSTLERGGPPSAAGGEGSALALPGLGMSLAYLQQGVGGASPRAPPYPAAGPAGGHQSPTAG